MLLIKNSHQYLMFEEMVNLNGRWNDLLLISDKTGNFDNELLSIVRSRNFDKLERCNDCRFCKQSLPMLISSIDCASINNSIYQVKNEKYQALQQCWTYHS